MSIFKNLFLKFSEQLPLRFLKGISPIDIYLPYQHLVSNDNASYVNHLYSYKNKMQFEKDIDYLLKYFKPIAVDDLVTYVKEQKPIAPNQFLLTFDDGFKECATVIAPILHKKGIPAVFFLNNNFIDNKHLFYRLKISLLIDHLLSHPAFNSVYGNHLQVSDERVNATVSALKQLNQNDEDTIDKIAGACGLDFESFLREVQPFLSTSEIDQLVTMGFNVGGHSLSHPYFQLIDDAEQVHEAVTSARRIAERFQQKYLLFSFPHSDKVIHNRVIEKILENGIDVLFGIQNQLPELHNRMLHRFNAERPGIPLRQQIKAEMLHTAIKRILGKYKTTRY